jgi:hypothetical protein
MNGTQTRTVKYGISADDAAGNPIVLRHFTVAEEYRIIHEVQFCQTVTKLIEMKRAGFT